MTKEKEQGVKQPTKHDKATEGNSFEYEEALPEENFWDDRTRIHKGTNNKNICKPIVGFLNNGHRYINYVINELREDFANDLFGGIGCIYFERDSLQREADNLKATNEKLVEALRECLQFTSRKGSVVTSSNTDGGWLPIESAPKDGTDILVSDKFGEVNQVVWLHCDELWASIGGKGDVWNYLTSEPSHWMPLPQPPKSEEN